jgi:hypothetical protein
MLIALLIAAATSPIDDSKIVDLTHPFDAKTIYWPTAKPSLGKRKAGGSMRKANGTRPPVMPRASMAERTSMRRSISRKAD